MKKNFDKSFFVSNRKKLYTQLLPDSLVVLFSAEQFPRNGDQFFKYRQNSDTYYFSGLTQEQTIIVLFNDTANKRVEEYAFIIEPDEKMLTWIGHKYSKQEASNISGIFNIEYTNKFDEIMNALLCKTTTIYYSYKFNVRGLNYQNPKITEWKNKIEQSFQNLYFNDLDLISMKLRLQKSSEEIAATQTAINITGEAFNKILRFVAPGRWEYEVEAELTRSFLAAGADDHAYLPICASGSNNCILHYNTNRNHCKAGDLLLLDFGAEIDYYAADISRTIPVSGKFSTRQKEVYNSVLSVLKQMKSQMIPGTTIRQLNIECEALIQEELIKLNLLTKSDIESQDPEKPALKKYFMHGLSHFIGLDVHDVGTKDTPLLPGMILSCEPAIYIADEGFGIRLENDILVADNPVDLCKNIPIEVNDVER
ncbi:MAG TPA: Xaa-Pro aminopeptidase [Bacteroidales bacterium]|nr:Xaa-Pro aminopeptidase [Bacteroidales bacterium]